MTAVTFWFIAWGLTLLVLGVLVWPMLSRRESPTGGDTGTRLAVYRQQLAELEEDRRQAVITDAQYEEAKCDIERRLLDETKPVQSRVPVRLSRVSSRAIAVAVAVLIPTVSGVLYWKLGSPPAIGERTVVPSRQGGSDSDHQTVEGLDALAAKLKRRLEQAPGDGAGWALLARSYVELGRHAEAVPIYEKAVQLVPDDAQLLADYADALGMLQERKLEGKPERLVRHALKIDPNNVKALMLAGTVAFDRKEFTQAAQYWERAVRNLPDEADAETRQELQAGIAEAKALAEGRPVPVAAGRTSSDPSQGPVSAKAITGTIRVAPALARKGSPDDTLFVFAREAAGPPMPVAAVRATGKDLPFAFRLDDTTSPMPSRKLSAATEVVVVARLSKSGEAMPKSGDLQGQSRPVKPGATGVTVLIDTELP